MSSIRSVIISSGFAWERQGKVSSLGNQPGEGGMSINTSPTISPAYSCYSLFIHGSQVNLTLPPKGFLYLQVFRTSVY